MRKHRFLVAVAIVLVVAGLLGGVLTGAFTSAARSGLYATGLLSDGGASTLPPGSLEHPAPPNSPEPEPEPAGGPPPVLAPATPKRPPKAARVAAKVDGVNRKALRGSFGGSVIDADSGAVLYAMRPTVGYIPASTTKLLTATAALSILGPQHQFSTRVVRPAAGRIVLVGGGDPYLTNARSNSYPARASLASLAQATAGQLKKAHQTKVTLGYDASLFTGPGWNPDWPAGYHDQVTHVSALWADEGRLGGASGPRQADPARTAADEFAGALKAGGIQVLGVARQTAPPGSTPVAAVKSMTLGQIVGQLLMTSDNDASEIVARQAAIGAGQPGSYTAARTVVKKTLTTLGVWDAQTRVRDGSGLSRKTRVPAQTMTKVVRLALEPAHPELRAVATGMPVAGVEGTLRRRFAESGSTAGRGYVRGKTGTLSGVHSMAGYVRGRDGSLLVFAFLTNGATDYFASRDWLDRVASALSTCGCR